MATDVASGFRHTATAGADGTFLMPGLTPGAYRIDVTAPSYKGATKEIKSASARPWTSISA